MGGISQDPLDLATSKGYRIIRGGTVSLRVSARALAAMDRAVGDGVRAFPSRGLEVGGLLSGPVGEEICVDAVLPFPMESRSSPAFAPAPSDLLFIKQSVAWAQMPGAGIIGHFRSQTSGEPAPNDADNTVADLLNLAEPLLVLIPASAAGIEPARVYRRINGAWTFLLAFPLVEPRAEGPGARALERMPEFAPGMMPAPSHSRRRMWVLGLLVIGLAAGIFWSRSRRTPPAPAASANSPINSEIRLLLHPEGSRLKVEWNPKSRAITEALAGMLTFQDGSQHLQVPLTRRELASGSTYYFPESGWVEVRLEVNRDGNHFAGETVAMPTGVAAKPPLPAVKSATQAVAVNRVARPAKAASAAPVIVSPPVVPVRAPAAIQKTSSIHYETAVPIRKVRPAVPADLHSILPESISVEIKVEIDSAGKVVSATPVDDLNATQKLLAPEAVQAALLWRFEPARRNGEPVASESLLKFDFERDTR